MGRECDKMIKEAEQKLRESKVIYNEFKQFTKEFKQLVISPDCVMDINDLRVKVELASLKKFISMLTVELSWHFSKIQASEFQGLIITIEMWWKKYLIYIEIISQNLKIRGICSALVMEKWMFYKTNYGSLDIKA